MLKLFTSIAIILIAVWPSYGISPGKQDTYKDPLDQWIDLLVQKESEGVSDITILDSNGKLSRGCLQFQDETTIEQARKYHLWESAEDLELINFVYDCVDARLLARTMLRNNPRSWTHWKASVLKIGQLPPSQ